MMAPGRQADGYRARGPVRRLRAGLLLAATLAAVTVGCAAPGGAGSAGTSGAPGVAAVSPGGDAGAGDAAVRTPAADRSAPYPELLPRTTGDAPLVLALGQVTPAIATPQIPVTIDATVTNRGTQPTRPRVQARLGARLLSRGDLDVHGTAQDSTPVGDSVDLAELAPGASAPVRLTIPAQALPAAGSYGVLPLYVEADLDQSSAVLETYLPYEIRKEYEPLSLSVAVPLVADPDPELSSPDAATAEKAWARATGAGSRLDHVLTGTAAGAVTYAIDPALLGPAPAAASTGQAAPTTRPSPATPTTTAAGSGTTAAGSGTTAAGSGTAAAGSGTTSAAPTAPMPTTTPPPATRGTSAPTTPPPATPTTPVSPARESLVTRLAGLAQSHPVWALPRNDPDVAALLRAEVDVTTLSQLTAPDDLIGQRLAPRTLTRVAWPGAALTRSDVALLATAYGSAWSGPLVLPLSTAGEAGTTGDAARHYPDGPTVVAYDDTLSRLLANAAGSSETTSAGLTQRFLAETMTILQEYPGRPRQVLTVAPRSFDPDPTTLAALLRTAESTPWVRTAATDALTAAARSQTAPDALAPQEADGAKEAFPTTGSPLDAGRIAAIQGGLDGLAGMASILPANSDLPGVTRDALLGLLGTRWRGREAAWRSAEQVAVEGTDNLVHGVAVIDSQVNFFAETGTLQVTVVNGLGVDVHDVQLRLVPQGRPRLRLPGTTYVLSIAAHSRATVKVPVEAIAAGPTVVSAQVSTPDGIRLGAQDATLTVQVQPTTGWVVLGIGGVAAVVFLVGLFRTIRRNRPRVSAEDLKEIDLE